MQLVIIFKSQQADRSILSLQHCQLSQLVQYSCPHGLNGPKANRKYQGIWLLETSTDSVWGRVASLSVCVFAQWRHWPCSDHVLVPQPVVIHYNTLLHKVSLLWNSQVLLKWNKKRRMRKSVFTGCRLISFASGSSIISLALSHIVYSRHIYSFGGPSPSHCCIAVCFRKQVIARPQDRSSQSSPLFFICVRNVNTQDFSFIPWDDSKHWGGQDMTLVFSYHCLDSD